MDRETMGQKIAVHLAIQGQIEGAKAELNDINSRIDSNEGEIKRLSALKGETDSLRIDRDTASKKLDGMAKDLKSLDGELRAVGAIVPSLVSSDVPLHIKL